MVRTVGNLIGRSWVQPPLLSELHRIRHGIKKNVIVDVNLVLLEVVLHLIKVSYVLLVLFLQTRQHLQHNVQSSFGISILNFYSSSAETLFLLATIFQ